MLFFKLAFIAFLNFSFAKEIVPVLLWNVNQFTSSVPSVSALQTIPFKQFKSEFLSQFGQNELPKNILLFLQDSLSVEDLSSHKKEFEYVAAEMKKGHSLFLPKVENPGFLETDLHPRNYNVIKLEPGESIAGISLKKSSNNLVVVKLPSTITNPSRSTALLKTAQVIKNVIEKIGKSADFTMMFTGLEASVRTDSQSLKRFKRQEPFITDEGLKENIANLHIGKCAMLYFRNTFTLTIKEGNTDTKLNLTDVETNDIQTDCQNDTTKLIIKFVNLPSFPKLWIGFHFESQNKRNWRAAFAEVSTRDNANDVFLYPSEPMMWVPIKRSYSCSSSLTLRSNSSKDSPSYYKLEIDGYQVEAFNLNITRFSDAWDCVPFFTIPIWSGVIVTFILLIILGWGMTMLADIKTMDRFDDAKGKHSLVPTNAE